MRIRPISHSLSASGRKSLKSIAKKQALNKRNTFNPSMKSLSNNRWPLKNRSQIHPEFELFGKRREEGKFAIPANLWIKSRNVSSMASNKYDDDPDFCECDENDVILEEEIGEIMESIKEEKENNMVDTVSNMVDTVSNMFNFRKIRDKAILMALNYTKSKAKQYFGTELMLSHGSMYNGDHAKSRAVGIFLKKYDKKFMNHFSFEDEDDYSTYKLVDGKVLIPIYDDKVKAYNTFIYVSSGYNIYGNDINKAFLMGLRTSPNDLYFYIFGKKCYHLMKELKKVLKETEEQQEDRYIGMFEVSPSEDKFNKTQTDIVYFKLKRRKVESLYYSNGEVEHIINHIDRFLKQETFYNEREILFKTGILLYGEPGTGKSTVAKVISSHFNRDIVNINIPKLKDINLSMVTEAINVDDRNRYVVLLEDIDTLFLNREDSVSDREDNAVINKLLQFLDSNSSPNNVIFIATTNHLSKLDSALLRDGRFDLKIEMKGINEHDAIHMAKDFGVKDSNIPKVLSDYKENDKSDGDTFNQAKLQNIILNYIGFDNQD